MSSFAHTVPTSTQLLEAPDTRGREEMFRRVATLIAVASATAVSALAAPDAHADPRDQQFLQMVHKNNIGGVDSTLVDYARQFCDSTGVQLPARPDLYVQGVRPDQFYAINLAASHVYCPQRLATPPTKSVSEG
jgi:hypothetical protein